MTRNLLNKLNKKKKGGFTLIELIIVIAIIAILAAVALPKFAAIRENANVKADISNAKNIQSEVISLIGENKLPTPATGAVLDITVDNTAAPSYTATVTTGMQGVPTLKAKDYKNKNFIVNIDDIGSVKIYADAAKTIQVYPKGDLVYANN